MGDGEGEGSLCPSHFELEQFGSQMFELGLQEVVVGVIVNLADVHKGEVLQEILPNDEKDSVFVLVPLGVLVV